MKSPPAGSSAIRLTRYPVEARRPCRNMSSTTAKRARWYVPGSCADAWRDHYLEYAARRLRIFSPHISLDASSAAPWIPFGRAEFDNICWEASCHMPQFPTVRNRLARPLNTWIDTHKAKFKRQCALEVELGACPLFALAVICRQTNSPVVKYVMARAVYKHLIVQFLSIRVEQH